jgi:hypothetical protein
MTENTKTELVLLTRGHLVLLGDDGKITVLERVSHKVVYYGEPSGDHPISAAASQIYKLAEAQQLPENLPVWHPYPYDVPTVENFALYEVPAGTLPSRDTFVYFRDAVRRAKEKGAKARAKRKK